MYWRHGSIVQKKEFSRLFHSGQEQESLNYFGKNFLIVMKGLIDFFLVIEIVFINKTIKNIKIFKKQLFNQMCFLFFYIF